MMCDAILFTVLSRQKLKLPGVLQVSQRVCNPGKYISTATGVSVSTPAFGKNLFSFCEVPRTFYSGDNHFVGTQLTYGVKSVRTCRIKFSTVEGETVARCFIISQCIVKESRKMDSANSLP